MQRYRQIERETQTGRHRRRLYECDKKGTSPRNQKGGGMPPSRPHRNFVVNFLKQYWQKVRRFQPENVPKASGGRARPGPAWELTGLPIRRGRGWRDRERKAGTEERAKEGENWERRKGNERENLAPPSFLKVGGAYETDWPTHKTDRQTDRQTERQRDRERGVTSI